MPRSILALACALACAVVASGCGAGNSLEGSIGEAYDLDFDYVRIRKQAETLIVEYIKEITGGENKALKIVLEGHKVIEEGQVIPLGPGMNIEGDLFAEAVTLSRVTPTGSDFPDVQNGILRLQVLNFSPGGAADGSFDFAFENGRTLGGGFTGHVEEIPLD